MGFKEVIESIAMAAGIVVGAAVVMGVAAMISEQRRTPAPPPMKVANAYILTDGARFEKRAIRHASWGSSTVKLQFVDGSTLVTHPSNVKVVEEVP